MRQHDRFEPWQSEKQGPKVPQPNQQRPENHPNTPKPQKRNHACEHAANMGTPQALARSKDSRCSSHQPRKRKHSSPPIPPFTHALPHASTRHREGAQLPGGHGPDLEALAWFSGLHQVGARAPLRPLILMTTTKMIDDHDHHAFSLKWQARNGDPIAASYKASITPNVAILGQSLHWQCHTFAASEARHSRIKTAHCQRVERETLRELQQKLHGHATYRGNVRRPDIQVLRSRPLPTNPWQR